VAFLACALFVPCSGEASFRQGVIGVRLSDRVGEYVAWSPDSRWIAEPARAGLRLRNVESGEVRSLRAPAYLASPFPPPGPLDWAPDGTIRYLTSPSFPPFAGSNASTLTEVRVDGSGVRRQSLDLRVGHTDWAPQGWPLVFAAGPYAYDFDKGPIGPKPSLFVVDGFDAAPRRILQIPRPVGEEAITEPAVSPDGGRIAYQRWGRGFNLSIWVIGAEGSDPKRLAGGLNAAFTLEWSPDDGTLALGAHTTARSGQQVHVVPAAGGKLRKIVDEEILDGPAWSPDGNWLAYSTHEGEIWRVHPDGSGRQLIATIPGREPKDLLWSPDGRRLAYSAPPPPRSD